MKLPLAPPPGLPLSTLDESARLALIQDYTTTDLSYLIPLITFVLIAFYGITECLKQIFPSKKIPSNWQEELLDPFIGMPSAPLTTTEIITEVYKKDPKLAAEAEPLFHQMDLIKFSTRHGELKPLIDKAKQLFVYHVNI